MFRRIIFLLTAIILSISPCVFAQTFVKSATLAAGYGLKAPADVAVIVPDGRLVVADRGNHRILILDPAGTTLLAIGSGKPGLRDGHAAEAQFKEPEAVVVDNAAKTIYVSDSGNHAVRRVTFEGVVTTVAAKGLKQPAGLAIDAAGNVYVADRGNHQIKRIASNGLVTAVAGTGNPGSKDGAALEASFQHPEGVAVDAAGTLFVADTQNRVIRMIANGLVSTITSADFHAPSRVRVAADGTLYVADTRNHVVSSVSAGVVSTVAGTGVPGYFESGDPAQAQLSAPQGLALEGALFVADTGNGVLRALYRTPAIGAIAPAQGDPAGGEDVVITGSGFVPGRTTLTFGGIDVAVTYVSSTELRVTTPAHAEGLADVAVTTPGGSATLRDAFRYVPPYVALSVSPNPLGLHPGDTQQLSAFALRADGTQVDVTVQASWQTSNAGVVTVNATGLVEAIGNGSASITATFHSLATAAAVSVTPRENLPPDPASIAPPIDPTVSTSFAGSTAFLYSGTNPIQRDVVPGTIQPKRVTVLRGRVLDRDGQPLPGARVDVHANAAFGYTLSRADGRFDLAVHGGGRVTLRYTKDGYLPVHRTTLTQWNEFRAIEDAVLTPLDARVAVIRFGDSTTQVAQSSLFADADGPRRTTMLFAPGTTATLSFADGTTQSAPSLHIRATEYSVGPNGPKAMPAPLPATSGYTHCVELSADEAFAAGADSVTFSHPVAVYTDNFLRFPVGIHVPTGYYDRRQALWVPIENGRVIEIVAVENGAASLDTTGDGVAESDSALALLGITPEERVTLASLYAAGAELWRVRISHFTPVDHNWGIWPALPSTATPPGQPRPTEDHQPDDPSTQCGSIIGCESQTLGEQLPIAGTPFSLAYQSARFPGRVAGRTAEIQLTGSTLPEGVEGVDLIVEVAGRSSARRSRRRPDCGTR